MAGAGSKLNFTPRAREPSEIKSLGRENRRGPDQKVGSWGVVRAETQRLEWEERRDRPAPIPCAGGMVWAGLKWGGADLSGVGSRAVKRGPKVG